MDKIELIEKYIKRCDECEKLKNPVQANALIEEIVAVFNSEIPDITYRLKSFEYGKLDELDYFDDISILKAKLVNYKTTLALEEQKRKDELKKLRLQQSIISIQNNSTSMSISNATNQANITLETVIENINNIEEKLSQEELGTLISLLTSLDMAKKKNDKSKTQEKYSDIMKFIADKTIQVGIAVLPYVMKAIQQPH